MNQRSEVVGQLNERRIIFGNCLLPFIRSIECVGDSLCYLTWDSHLATYLKLALDAKYLDRTRVLEVIHEHFGTEEAREFRNRFSARDWPEEILEHLTEEHRLRC